MDEKRGDAGFEDVADLMREDKEQALRTFRQGRFDEKVRNRIAAGAEKEGAFYGRKAAVLASGAALLLLTAAAWLFLSRRSNPIPQGGPGPMMAVLEDLPGISGLVGPGENVPPSEVEAFNAARTVLTVILERKDAEAKKSVVSARPVKVPRLSLEKKMEILFKERVIERVLVSLQKKSEEV